MRKSLEVCFEENKRNMHEKRQTRKTIAYRTKIDHFIQYSCVKVLVAQVVVFKKKIEKQTTTIQSIHETLIIAINRHFVFFRST